MTRVAKFGNVMARDCRLLAIRVPADVVAKLEAASTDGRATSLLYQLAMAVGGGEGYAKQKTAKA